MAPKMTAKSKSRTRWWILGATGAVLGIILLDETVISVALPTIQKDLGLSRLDAHWVVNIYLLVLACLAGAAGRLGDMLSTRWLMTFGLVIFGVSSALGGFSDNGSFLLLARAAQGVGAAVIFPLSLVILVRSFDEDERGLALGLYGAIGTVFLSLGPLAGGLLTEYLSWRWIFWVNPPIVLVVTAILLACWRDSGKVSRTGFDVLGFVLLVVGLAAMVFGIMEGPDRGWTQPDVLIPMITGLTLLWAFVLVELRSTSPLIAVSLFSSASFAASNMIIFTAQFGKIVLLVFGATYFQSRLGLSPLTAGASLIPVAIPQVFLAPLAGRIADQYGTRIPSLCGLLCGIVATSLTAIGMFTGTKALLYLAFLLWGCCAPFLFVPPRRAVMTSVPDALHGQASGISMTFQLLGGTVGMALASTIYAITESYSTVFALIALFVTGIFLFALYSLEQNSPTKQVAGLH